MAVTRGAARPTDQGAATRRPPPGGAPPRLRAVPTAGPTLPRVLAPVADAIAGARRQEPFRRDADYLRRQLPLVARYASYFSPTVRGLANLPATGPVLVVGNHSCVFWMPEVPITGLAVLERRGLDQPAYGLAYDLLLAIPGVGGWLRRVGALPADPRSAARALADGAAVLVYPGGDREACRPWTERDRVDLGGHRGFVELAIRTGAPLVPVVAHGGHHAVAVLTRGDRLARAIGLPALRIKVFPLLLAPWGIVPLVAPPAPAAVTVEFLPPIRWDGPRRPRRGELAAGYRQVEAVLQQGLDRLHAEDPHPVLTGGRRLLGRAASTRLGRR